MKCGESFALGGKASSKSVLSFADEVMRFQNYFETTRRDESVLRTSLISANLCS